MFKRKLCWIITVVAFLVFGLSSSGLAARSEKFEPISIPEGKAVIYIYKPYSYGKGKYSIVINDRVITILQKGGYFPHIVEPGQIEIILPEFEKAKGDTVRAGAVGVISGGAIGGLITATVWALLPKEIVHSVSLDVAPDQAYYVAEIKGPRVGLKIEEEITALKDLRKCWKLEGYTGQ
jgi:hypothetical protein